MSGVDYYGYFRKRVSFLLLDSIVLAQTYLMNILYIDYIWEYFKVVLGSMGFGLG